MTKAILMAGAAALILSGGSAIADNFPGKAQILYDQTGEIGEQAVDSQNYESSLSAYDDRAADDFTVPAGVIWTITEVDAPGIYFNGTGPAGSVNVIVAHAINSKGTGANNGKTIAAFDNVVPKDNAGSFSIPLGKGVRLKAEKLTPCR